jgi:hypothetical protein
MKIYEVVVKLIGPIMPIGETNTDDERLENLKEMTNLVDRLIYDIGCVIHNKNRPEYSMKKAGKFADDFFDSLGLNH